MDHFAALSFLRGLLLILKDSGYSGLVLVLDEIETLQRVRGDVREKGLNALRQLIDDIDGGRFPNLYLLITGTPAFFDGPQGIQRLEPLAQRLHVDFQTDARFDNPRAVQLRLPSFDHDRLVEVGIKVRDLFMADCSSPERVRRLADDELHRCAGPLRGRQAGRQGRHRPPAVPEEAGLRRAGPDRPVRRLRPDQHYQLTVNTSEMTADRAGSAGQDRGRHRAGPVSAFDRLHPALQHHIVNSLGWRELRPVQNLSIDAYLGGANLVVLAPTAGGKTEAAFFPVISQMLTESWTGLSVLYVSPIRALLNNQEQRLQRYFRAGRQAGGLLARRHDARETSGGLVADPPDCLLTTPESLEVDPGLGEDRPPCSSSRTSGRS